MIISGGVNIYPQEAENVLVTHPKVVDVAVFGVPNDDFGEEVKAVVQPVEMPADADEADGAGQGADRLLPRAASPTSSARARSTSAPSSPATRPASSTSATSRTSTGRPPAARSERSDAPDRSARTQSSENAGDVDGAVSGPIAGAQLGVGEAPERRRRAGRRSARPACASASNVSAGEAVAGDDDAVGRLVVGRPSATSPPS